MSHLEGPRMYYSLFGPQGLIMGARARLFRRPITVAVEAPGILHPVFLRLRTTDVHLCSEILLDGLYEWELPETPKVIVDVGANIGLSTIFYANRFPSARIIAIEPHPFNYEMLKKNTALYPNVTTMRAALWKENRELNIFDPGGGNTTFRTGDNRGVSGAEGAGSVAGITLDKLMADYELPRVDFMKIDVEGAEKEIFAHADPWIDRVGLFAIELHDWIEEGCGKNVRLGAKDFHFEWQRGEITYFARNGPDGEAARGPQAQDSGKKSFPANRKFPLRILHAS
jgi:FkbM family methyltransferase